MPSRAPAASAPSLHPARRARSLPLRLAGAAALAFLVLLSVAAPVAAATLVATEPVATAPRDDLGQVLSDEWGKLVLNGAPAGYVHTLVRRTETGDISTWVETRMRMGRMGSSVSIVTEQTQIEDADGQVLRLKSRTQMPGETVSTAEVQGDTLSVTIETEGSSRSFTEAWDDRCRGPEHWKQALVEWLPGQKPGAVFESHVFDLELGSATRVVQELVGEEDGLILMRSQIDALEGMVQDIRMRPDGTVEHLSMKLMGLDFSTETCDREEALAAYSENGLAPEIFNETVLRPDRPLPRPRSLDRVVFRLSAKDPAIPFPDFSSSRQRIVEQRGGEMVLEIRRVVPGEGEVVSPPGPGAREANPTLESDHPDIIALAAELAGDAAGDWEVARALERGVYEYIDKKSMGVAFATAHETCRSRSGDCSEHAVLLAALARAEGIPSRVAMGLTYVGGIFGGHAWTEVYIDGEWIALDGTNGLGSVDASHIRFGVSELDGLGMGAEMFASLIGLANLEIVVLETEHNGQVVTYDGDSSKAPFTVDGQTLSSAEYGVHLDAPDGFDWDRERQPWMSGRLARAEGPDGRRLSVYAEAVDYSFGEDDLVEDDADGIQMRIKAGGRPAVVDGSGAWTLRVLDGDTVFHARLDGEEDEDLALEMLLLVGESLRFDA